MREMVEESLSGTWAGMAQGDLAPEMMSSTKLSTVSRERGGGRATGDDTSVPGAVESR